MSSCLFVGFSVVIKGLWISMVVGMGLDMFRICLDGSRKYVGTWYVDGSFGA